MPDLARQLTPYKVYGDSCKGVLFAAEDLDGKKKLTVTLVKAAHCSGQADWPTLLTNAPMPALNTVVV
jgi:hypothetical protein